MSLSIGKRRGLAQCSTSNQVFSVLALDHRNNLRYAINPGDPDAVLFDQMVGVKKKIVSALAPVCSAVLLDPEIGTAPVIYEDALPGNKGLVIALEATGYEGESVSRVSRILTGWSVGKARQVGANAVKLLVYYYPGIPQARAQEDLVSEVAETCQRHDIPFIIEPLSYSPDPGKKTLSSKEKCQVVLETALRLTRLGADVLKAEFPIDTDETPSETEWEQACNQLTAASQIPWVLLSAGVDYETYLRQVEVACRCGASGIMAGRAVWKEVTELAESEQMDFLLSTAAQRMKRLSDICETAARPWSVYYPSQNTSIYDWYKTYPENGEGKV